MWVGRPGRRPTKGWAGHRIDPQLYVYFEVEPQRQMSTKRLNRDEAFLVAVNIAKLPRVPRQILKDIPKPPENRAAMLWAATGGA